MSPQRDYLAPMQEMAREAGALLMSHFGKVEIEYKGDVDLVTMLLDVSHKQVGQLFRECHSIVDVIEVRAGAALRQHEELSWAPHPPASACSCSHQGRQSDSRDPSPTVRCRTRRRGDRSLHRPAALPRYRRFRRHREYLSWCCPPCRSRSLTLFVRRQ